jgi:hypothetical protein
VGSDCFDRDLTEGEHVEKERGGVRRGASKEGWAAAEGGALDTGGGGGGSSRGIRRRADAGDGGGGGRWQCGVTGLVERV